MGQRKVLSIRAALRTVIGGLDTRIPFSGPPSDMLDPFLLLAHHGPQVIAPNSPEPPFGPHPHRGFETVTFILHGEVNHIDSLGNQELIHSGGVQWLTAGAGVVHGELSPENFWTQGGKLEILQLWVNLPARLKMTQPRYVGVEAADFSVVTLSDGAGIVDVVSGSFANLAGPITSLTGIFLSIASLRPSARVMLPTPTGRTVLFYVVDGELTINGETAKDGDLVTFSDGDSISVDVVRETKILFGHGDAIGEPVVAGGPFVMNDIAEIDEAWADYRSGKFGQLLGPVHSQRIKLSQN